MLACVKIPTSATAGYTMPCVGTRAAHECHVCIDGEQTGWPVVAGTRTCELSVNNARYKSIGKLYSEL